MRHRYFLPAVDDGYVKIPKKETDIRDLCAPLQGRCDMAARRQREDVRRRVRAGIRYNDARRMAGRDRLRCFAAPRIETI
jgi:hypothetical protein